LGIPCPAGQAGMWQLKTSPARAGRTKNEHMKLSTELITRATNAAHQQYLSFHNGSALYEQAIRLVQKCNMLAVQNDVGNEEKIMVHLAGMFLFSGGDTPDFLAKGIGNLTEFLQHENIDEEILVKMREVILSLKPPQMPMTAAGQVLCDALNSFWVEENKALDIDLPGFVQECIAGKSLDTNLHESKRFLEKMKFFTPAAIKMFKKPKKKKLAWFQKGIDHQGKSSPLSDAAVTGIEFLMKDDEKPQMARGTETMFRIASREHAELMSNVHQKSGFLASINAIILSIILSVLSTKLDENPHLLIPTILLLITCVSTIYFVIMATRPVFINPSNESFNTETQNIMFFGHFSNMAWKDYRDKLKVITRDDIALFDTFSKNIYYQGLILKKKYNLLAVGYNIFIGGLIISILAFVISLVLRSYGAGN
jgi:hypothetical protein